MRLMTKMMDKKEYTTTKVGIDYSLTSPAVYVDGKYYYLTNKKKWLGAMSEDIIGYEHKEYKTPIHRFKQISNFVLDIISDYKSPKCYIEGYAYGAKGQGLFQIAENGGILKYRLEEQNIPYEIVVPSVVKKGATGKGNADKDMMYEAFVKETGIDLKKIFDTTKVGNPISDIADSYFIAKVGYEKFDSK